MRRQEKRCPGPADRHPIFDDDQVREWMCQHQLQLQLVAYTDTIDPKAEELTRFQNAMFATLWLDKLTG